MKIGDVIKINGISVTIEGIDDQYVHIVWFEGDVLFRGKLSHAIAEAQPD